MLRRNNTVRMHLHYALFAEILRELAKTASSVPLNKDTLRDAAKALYLALDAEAADSKDDNISKMTPEWETVLLHIME